MSPGLCVPLVASAHAPQHSINVDLNVTGYMYVINQQNAPGYVSNKVVIMVGGGGGGGGGLKCHTDVRIKVENNIL